MEEKAQGATEYLLMLAIALTMLSLVTALALDIFDTLGSSVEGEISRVENRVIEELTGY